MATLRRASPHRGAPVGSAVQAVRRKPTPSRCRVRCDATPMGNLEMGISWGYNGGYIYIYYIPRGLTGLLLSGFLGRVWTPGAALRKILLFRRAPPSPRLVRQGDSAFFIICIVCSFFPGSFGIVFSQLCNVFCVGPPSPPGALSSLSPLWGCMPLGTYKQLTSQLGSLLQPGPDSFHPWFHT